QQRRSPSGEMPRQGNCGPNGGMDLGIDDHPAIVQRDGNRWNISRGGVGIGTFEQPLPQGIYHLSVGQLRLCGECRTSKDKGQNRAANPLSKDQGSRSTSVQKDIGQSKQEQYAQDS